MTIEDHKKWVRLCLKTARKAVAERDWRTASTYFGMAAHHEAVVKAARAVSR